MYAKPTNLSSAAGPIPHLRKRTAVSGAMRLREQPPHTNSQLPRSTGRMNKLQELPLAHPDAAHNPCHCCCLQTGFVCVSAQSTTMRILDKYFRKGVLHAAALPISEACITTTLQQKASSTFIFDRARAEVLDGIGVGKLPQASFLFIPLYTKKPSVVWKPRRMEMFTCVETGGLLEEQVFLSPVSMCSDWVRERGEFLGSLGAGRCFTRRASMPSFLSCSRDPEQGQCVDSVFRAITFVRERR